jgi:hypothetical protein
MGPEAKLYQNVKQNFKQFSLIRLENISLLGTPDLLVCNTSGHFCTVELKVTKGNKIRFSPHQIAFHIKHPHNTFILVKALGPLPPKTSPISMYHGSRIEELVTSGLKLEACSLLLLGAWDLRPGPGRTLVASVEASSLMA